MRGREGAMRIASEGVLPPFHPVSEEPKGESTRSGIVPTIPQAGDRLGWGPIQGPRTMKEAEFRQLWSTDQNPEDIGFLALVREDLRTHEGLTAQGFWALFANRLGNWRMGIRWSLLRFPFSLFYKALAVWVHWTTRIELPYIAPCGRRVRIWHHGGCVLGARHIGDDVQIRHNGTLAPNAFRYLGWRSRSTSSRTAGWALALAPSPTRSVLTSSAESLATSTSSGSLASSFIVRRTPPECVVRTSWRCPC